MMWRMPFQNFLVFFFCLFSFTIARAWVYPEHRQIALLVIQDLAPENRLLLK
jgi:hypothetical protein